MARKNRVHPGLANYSPRGALLRQQIPSRVDRLLLCTDDLNPPSSESSAAPNPGSQSAAKAIRTHRGCRHEIQSRVERRWRQRNFSRWEDTIRRDLRELAQEGLLQRVHGGALPEVTLYGRFWVTPEETILKIRQPHGD
jgi:hypothetical protein